MYWLKKKEGRKENWKIIYIIELRQKWAITQILIETIATVKGKIWAP